MRGPRPPARRAARRAPPGGPRRRRRRGPEATPIITAERPTPPHPCTASQEPGPSTTVHRDRAEGRREPAAEGRRGDDIDGVGEPHHVEVGGVDRDPLGEGPRAGEARLVCRGQTWTRGRAVLAGAAAADERDGDTVADRHRVTSGPAAATTPANSCPGTWGGQRVMSLPRVPVRPAHPCRPDRDDDAVGGQRLGDLGHLGQGPVLGEDHGSHGDIIGPAVPVAPPGPVRC